MKYCLELEEEALALGAIRIASDAIYRLKEAVESQRVTEQILTNTWNAFGSDCSYACMSGVATVQN